MAEAEEPQEPQGVAIKIGDEELKGRYANLLRIAHTREEFILDFIHVVPPQGIVTARVVTSPGHLKRIVQALAAIEKAAAAGGPFADAVQKTRTGIVEKMGKQ